jgi:hypothetical protein
MYSRVYFVVLGYKPTAIENLPISRWTKYRVIINYCPIAVGVGDVVEYAASLIT